MIRLRRIEGREVLRTVLRFTVVVSFAIAGASLFTGIPGLIAALSLLLGILAFLALADTSEYIRGEDEQARELAADRAVTNFHGNLEWLRSTEHYGGVAGRLDSADVHARLAGMRELEQLSKTEQDPGHRQRIVHLLCSYLSRPFGPSVVEPADVHQAEVHQGMERRQGVERRQEGQVRRRAQRILGTHLRDGPDSNPLFWSDIDLLLDGAELRDWDMSAWVLRKASFSATRFTGRATFAGATVDGPASFREAEFGARVSFNGVRFANGARFGSACFQGGATFVGTSFDCVALTLFETANPLYNGVACFDSARFAERVSFDDAVFWGPAEFAGTRFERDASFRGAKFHGTVSFSGAWFGTGEASGNP